MGTAILKNYSCAKNSIFEEYLTRRKIAHDIIINEKKQNKI